MVFRRKDLEPESRTQNESPAVRAEAQPAILIQLERELQAMEAETRSYETALASLNVKAAELSSQIAWLKRTPQAITILTQLCKRNWVTEG